jgi:HEAT repeat protein
MEPTQTRTLANDWLKDLCLALRNVALYSEEHPRGQEYVERAFDSLRRVMGERDKIFLARSDKRLMLDQVILDRDRALSDQFAGDLADRGVDGVVIHDSITPAEHLGFIRAMLMKPDRVADKGGFGPALLDEGVSAVKVAQAVASRAEAPAEISTAVENSLMRMLAHLGRGHGGHGGHGAGSAEDAGTSDTAGSLLGRDPAALARALMIVAHGRGGRTASTESVAEAVAEALERLAERAIEEHQRDRSEILADVGRALVHADPELHPPLFLEKAGPRSIRKNLAAAVEGLRPESIAELVAAHLPRAGGDYTRLIEILNRITAWRTDRSATLAAVRSRLTASGLSEEEFRDLADHLIWSDLTMARRLELLYSGELLWRVDFTRVKEVLVKLFATDRIREATNLIQKYLSGLLSSDLELRRRVADNTRYLLHLIEKTGKGQAMLGRIADMFFTRLQDEPDADVVARLAGGLAFLADLWMRSDDLGSALDLMRKAERLGDSSASMVKARGGRLAEALARAGSDKVFKRLTDLLLNGSDQATLEAAEILKRGGNRSATFLIERLAEEENRSHRARLVMLLKDMGKGSSSPFVSRLDDSRWFLVRNVVGILGDIGDPGVLPELKSVAAHGDPRVRREVVRTFARFGTAECEELIVAAVADEDRGVQITAVNALATLKGRRSLSALADVAKKAGPFEEISAEVRQEAIASLGKVGAPEAVHVLREIITRRGFLGPTEPTEVRVAAAKALGALRAPEALALLKELSEKDPRQAVRDAAREALAGRASASINPPR